MYTSQGLKINFRCLFAGTGDGESIDKFLIEEEREKLWENLERGIRVKSDQGLQRNWNKIDKSSYCRDNREWKKEPERVFYWGSND